MPVGIDHVEKRSHANTGQHGHHVAQRTTQQVHFMGKAGLYKRDSFTKGKEGGELKITEGGSDAKGTLKSEEHHSGHHSKYWTSFKNTQC